MCNCVYNIFAHLNNIIFEHLCGLRGCFMPNYAMTSVGRIYHDIP